MLKDTKVVSTADALEDTLANLGVDFGAGMAALVLTLARSIARNTDAEHYERAAYTGRAMTDLHLADLFALPRDQLVKRG